MNKKKGIISCLMWQISIIDFSCPDISTWKSWRFCQQGAWNPTPKRKKRRPKFLRNIFPKGVSRAWKSLHFRIGGSVSSAMSNNSIFFGPTVKFKWDTIFSFFSIAQRTASQVPFWGWSTANFWDHLLLLILGPSHLHWTHPSPFPAHYWVGPSICLAPDLVKKKVWHLQAERKISCLFSFHFVTSYCWHGTLRSPALPKFSSNSISSSTGFLRQHLLEMQWPDHLPLPASVLVGNLASAHLSTHQSPSFPPRRQLTTSHYPRTSPSSSESAGRFPSLPIPNTFEENSVPRWHSSIPWLWFWEKLPWLRRCSLSINSWPENFRPLSSIGHYQLHRLNSRFPCSVGRRNPSGSASCTVR